MSRRRLASLLGYAGGLCLVAAGSSGSAALHATILAWLASGLGPAGQAFIALAVVLGLLAAFGGFTVILGAWLIGRGSVRTGAFLLPIGAGAGLFGLAVNLTVLILDRGDVRPFLAGAFAGLGGLGVLLAIAAATYANPVPVGKWWRRARRAARPR